MLFCDVQGSTAAAERLDPEEWVGIMNGAFEHLISPVYKYEGTVAHMMGDAILAFFGAPIAHEDDPQRAVLAGLDILKAVAPYRESVCAKWGIEFNVRVGINTGLVVIGEVGSDLKVEYTAIGDAVNLAARMEQTAVPGTVQITDNTQRLIAPLFDFENLGEIEVKGKAEPVQSYRVTGVKAAPGSLRGIAGLDSPLIGRETQMATLRRVFDDLAEGSGQLCAVMGEPGLGKSRLTAELRTALEAEGLLAQSPNGEIAASGRSRWYEGRSLSYQTASPYAPFIDLFGDILGTGLLGSTDETDSNEYQGLSERIEELVPGDNGACAPFIGAMLGIEPSGADIERISYLTPPQLGEGITNSCLRILEKLAEAQPTVVVFEDLHWVDPTSLDLLERVMALTDRLPLMVLALFRPWRQEPSWRFHEAASRDYSHRYTDITLSPLNDGEARELVQGLLHVEGLPVSVRELILEKAEGNPFFVEEVIRSLLDAGLVVKQGSPFVASGEIEGLSVPNTLTGVISARLDRLEVPARLVVQTASVIGREFGYDPLVEIHGEAGADVIDTALTELLRRELIREKSGPTGRSYAFKHAMTQETAYSTLLLSRRRELHRRAAECMVAGKGDAGQIGRHFLEAGEDQRALPYLVSAADLAARNYATKEAIDLYELARDRISNDGDPATTRGLYEGLGGALSFANRVPEAVETFERMLELGSELADKEMQVSALNKLGFISATRLGEVPAADRYLEDANRIANSCGDRAGLAEMYMTYCFMRTTEGELDKAYDHMANAASIGEDLDLADAELFGLTHLANTYVYMAEFEKGRVAAKRAWKAAEARDNLHYQSEILVWPEAMYHLRNGDIEKAQQAAMEGTELAARIGAKDSESIGAYFAGQIARFKGEYQLSLELHERAIEAAAIAGYFFVETVATCGLGTVKLDISPALAEEAEAAHDLAAKAMDKPLGTAFASAALCKLGFCELAAGKTDLARDYFEKADSSPNAAAILYRPLAQVGLGLLSLMAGDPEGAKKQIATATEFVEAKEMHHFYPVIAMAAGQLAGAAGDVEAALDHMERMERTAEEMNMRPFVWQAKAGIAGMLDATGRPAEAEAKRQEARAVIEEIGELFTDEHLKTIYLENAGAAVPEPA